MPQVTVIIPNYNGMKYLPDCLEALTTQTGSVTFGVLVVDNGSTDESLLFLQEHFPKVEVLALPENTGFCHAVNIGIKKADSPYVILLNNDTKVLPEFVEKLYQAILDKEKVFSVSAKMLMWDQPQRLDGAGDRYCLFGFAFARGKGKSASLYDKSEKVFSACGGAAIYQKQVFEQIGYFDELHFAYLEDLDIGYRARIYGYENLYEPGAQVVHFGSASSGARYNEWKTKVSAANNIYVLHKNMPFLQLIINLPFLVLGYLIKYLFFCKKGLGKVYIEGIQDGFKKARSLEGKRNKVAFSCSHLKNYVAIQWQLIVGTFRR